MIAERNEEAGELEFVGEREVRRSFKVVPEKVACPLCHGMGYREKLNGDTFPCPHGPCKDGFVIHQ